MARYQSFAALGTILEASLQKKRHDIDKAFKALDVSMQSQLLKEKIAQQSWENDMKLKEFNINAEIRKEQLITEKQNRRIQNKKWELEQWKHTKEKLEGLESESLDLGLLSVDKFHASLGTSFSEGDTWLEDMKEALEDRGVNENYSSRLLDASMKASKGNSLPTSLLIEELDQAVKQYNMAPDLVTPQQQELIRFYLGNGAIEFEQDLEGNVLGVKPTARFQNIFNSSLISSGNLRKIDKEQIELFAKDDAEIQSTIDIAEYVSLESQLRQLDLTQVTNQIKEAREGIEKQRLAKEMGITIDEVDLEQSIDALEAAEADIETTEDQIDISRRKIQNLETTSSLIGIDAEAQIKQLNDDILAKKATLQALTVTRDRAEYDRDIDYALVHLKKLSTPDMDTYPEHGYSNEQIDNMLEYLESVIAESKSGRVLNTRELMEAGRYIGL